MNQSVLQMQALLDDLLRRRREMRLDFNRAHPTIIDRMPVGLINHIFEFVAQETSPLFLGSICRSWRHIAWSIPSLWTSFSFTVKGRSTQAKIQIAKDWLARSGNLPLYVKMRQQLGSQLGPDPLLAQLIDEINQRSDQWRSLDLTLQSSILQEFNDDGNPSSRLHTLILNSLHGCSEEPLHITHGQPSVVYLRWLRLCDLTFHWDSLTDVSAQSFTVNEILRTLRLAPNLRCAKFPFVRPESDSDQVVTKVQAPHLHLEELMFRSNDQPTLVHLLSSNGPALPSLKRLYGDFFHHQGVSAALAAFLVLSSCALEDLWLISFTISTNEDLLGILRLTPMLTSLKLESCDLPPLSVVDLNGDASEPLPPRLEEFRWFHGRTFSWEFLLSLLSPFQETQPHRRPLKRLELLFKRHRYWDPIPYIDQVTMAKLAQLRLDATYIFQIELGFGNEDLLELSSKKLKNGSNGT